MRKEDLINISQNVKEDEYNEFYKGYSDSISGQIENIYIDLTYLNDIYLGGILSYTQDKDVYQYILSCMDRYNNRCTDEYIEYFPDLNLNETELNEYIKNNSKLLIKISPPTIMYKFLPNIHNGHLLDNKYKVGLKEPVRKITYVINTYPLVLDEEDMKFLKKKFIYTIKDSLINFGVISKPSNNLSINTYKKFNIWYLSNLESWSNKDSNGYLALYKNLLLRNSKIYIEPRIYNKEILSKMNELTERDFKSIEQSTILNLNCFADVNYLRSPVLIKK